jgi:uncharacterized protein YcbK (DUF882 family)
VRLIRRKTCHGNTARSPARVVATLGCAALALVLGVRGTQDAIANGDTRSISILHMHTKESVRVTFKRNGYYDAEALKQLNWILRDWRRDEPTKMDPRLFDIAWEVHREVGSSQPFHVVSAYRSPATNSMLRRRSRGVAKQSQHMEGKAMDFYLPDASSAQIRAVGMKLQRGGVGYYPTAYTPFIHLDVGSVRSWPRMTRDQLARLFPDGRTVHIPADGQPLEGYEMAKAEILSRGGSVGGYASRDFDEGAIMQTSRRSLWASLFGWNEEDESRPGGARGRSGRGASAPLAYAPSGNSDSADMFAVFRAPEQQAARAPQRPAATARQETARQETARQETARQEARPETAAEPAAPTAASAPAASQPAAPPPPPQPRFVDAPFPIARPAGLQAPVQIAAVQPGATGDRLQWQTGAAAAQSAGMPDIEALARPVSAPLPPRRPEGLPQVAAASAQAEQPAVPAPQARLVAVDHPAPPERPRLAMAVASRPPAAALPAATTASAPPAGAALAATIATPSLADRRALDSLFTAAAMGSAAPQPPKVNVAKPRQAQVAPSGPIAADNAPAAALGFTTVEPQETRVDRFTGPAVRPLPTTFTSR